LLFHTWTIGEREEQPAHQILGNGRNFAMYQAELHGFNNKGPGFLHVDKQDWWSPNCTSDNHKKFNKWH